VTHKHRSSSVSHLTSRHITVMMSVPSLQHVNGMTTYRDDSAVASLCTSP